MRRCRGGLLASYLEVVSEVLNGVLAGGACRLHTFTSLTVLIVLVVSTAYTDPFPFTFISMIPIIVALILSAISHRLAYLLKTIATSSLFLTVISLPLIFYLPGRPLVRVELGFVSLTATVEGLSRASAFFLRCLNTISISLGWMSLVGVDSLIEGLRFIDPSGTIPLLLFLSTRYIPLSIRETVRILAARESRMMRRDRGVAWMILSTSIGDLLLRSLHRAERVGMAMRARALSGRLPSPITHSALSLRDLIVLPLVALYIVIYSLRWLI